MLRCKQPGRGMSLLRLKSAPSIWAGTYIGLPSCGLRNRTPSSVIFANLSSETIWKLFDCESVIYSVGEVAEGVCCAPTNPPLSVRML